MITKESIINDIKELLNTSGLERIDMIEVLLQLYKLIDTKENRKTTEKVESNNIVTLNNLDGGFQSPGDNL